MAERITGISIVRIDAQGSIGVNFVADNYDVYACELPLHCLEDSMALMLDELADSLLDCNAYVPRIGRNKIEVRFVGEDLASLVEDACLIGKVRSVFGRAATGSGIYRFSDCDALVASLQTALY